METKTETCYTDGENLIWIDRNAAGRITAWGVEVDGATDMRTDRLDEIEERIAAGLREGSLAIYS